jgi:hypothetical protein
VSWRGFWSNPWFAMTWLGMARAQVEIRSGLRWVPYLGVRILRHELDHIRDPGFRHPDPVHDRHICGRSHAWYSFWTSRHLQTTIGEAAQLRASGRFYVEKS